MENEKVKLINPNWYSTLEFLAGMLDENKAQEIVEEASRNYFELKQEDSSQKILPEVFSEMDLAYRITSDQNLSGKKKLSCLLNEVPHLMNKDYFRAFSEKTQNFMLEYTQKTMPELAKSKWKARLVIPLLLLSTGLSVGAWWYSHNGSEKEKAELLTREKKEDEELLARGRKECEEVTLSPDLIECFRYYALNKEGKIIELEYEEGFRPRETDVLLESVFGYTKIQKKLVWRLKTEECFDAYPLGGGKAILEKDWNQLWEFKYSNKDESYAAAAVLEGFCSKKPKDLEDDYQDFPTFRIAPKDRELSALLGKGRPDCDWIAYSSTLIECIKEYVVDNDGVVLEPDLRMNFSGGDCDDECDELQVLVWSIKPEECQRVYDAGAGVVIVELEGGRVWEFKYNPYKKREISIEEKEKWYQAYLNVEKETPEPPEITSAEMIAMELQDFCKGGNDGKLD